MKIEQFVELEIKKLRHGSVRDFLVDHSTMVRNIDHIRESWHQGGASGPFWMELIEPLVVKIILQSASLENLLEGTVVSRHKDPTKAIDMSSIYTLARAQLEAYLTFFYLYVQPKSEDEHLLRYYLFVIHSLTVRQAAGIITGYEDKIKREAEQIAVYQDRIRKNPVFLSWTKQNQNRLINGETAKEMGWERLIKASTLRDEVKRTYDLYANHSH